MSVKIYRTTDRVNIKIGDLTFKLSPLSFYQKMEVTSQKTIEEGQSVEDIMKMTFMSIKFAVKEVEGFVTVDGSKYELSFDEQGNLTDQCVEELLNSEVSEELMYSALNMVNGVPSVIRNPITGAKIEGVEIVTGKSKRRSKKVK